MFTLVQKIIIGVSIGLVILAGVGVALYFVFGISNNVIASQDENITFNKNPEQYMVNLPKAILINNVFLNDTKSDIYDDYLGLYVQNSDPKEIDWDGTALKTWYHYDEDNMLRALVLYKDENDVIRLAFTKTESNYTIKIFSDDVSQLSNPIEFTGSWSSSSSKSTGVFKVDMVDFDSTQLDDSFNITENTYNNDYNGTYTTYDGDNNWSWSNNSNFSDNDSTYIIRSWKNEDNDRYVSYFYSSDGTSYFVLQNASGKRQLWNVNPNTSLLTDISSSWSTDKEDTTSNYSVVIAENDT